MSQDPAKKEDQQPSTRERDGKQVRAGRAWYPIRSSSSAECFESAEEEEAMPGVEPGAPWGEVVSNAPYPMTVQDFQRWRGVAESYYCELVNGHLIQTPWQGMGGSLAAINLAARLLFAAKRQHRGYAVTGSYFSYTHRAGVRADGPLGEPGLYFPVTHAPN